MVPIDRERRIGHPARYRAEGKKAALGRGRACRCTAIGVLFPLILFLATAYGGAPGILFKEHFDSLARWEPLTFPKIAAHSTYTLVNEGEKSVLKAESRASASAYIDFIEAGSAR